MKLRKALAHQVIGSSCPLLRSHVQYTARSNAVAVKLPGTLVSLALFTISAQPSSADTRELQPAVGVGLTTRSTGGDVESAGFEDTPSGSLEGEQHHVENKFVPAS